MVSRSDRKRKAEPITAGDRLVCAGFGAVAGLGFWTSTYAVLFLGAVVIQSKPAVAARIDAGKAPATPWEILPEFWYWGGVCAAILALYGSVAGPKRMMDGFETLFRMQLAENSEFLAEVGSDHSE